MKKLDWATERLLAGEETDRVRIYRNVIKGAVYTECEFVMFGRRLYLSIRH